MCSSMTKTRFLRVDEAQRCRVPQRFVHASVCVNSSSAPFLVSLRWFRLTQTCCFLCWFSGSSAASRLDSSNPTNYHSFVCLPAEPVCPDADPIVQSHCPAKFPSEPLCLLLKCTTCRVRTFRLDTSPAFQEVQLYTADPDQDALTVGLRTPLRPPASGSPKPTMNRQDDKQTPSATMTHCSASSLHVQRRMIGVEAPQQPPYCI